MTFPSFFIDYVCLNFSAKRKKVWYSVHCVKLKLPKGNVYWGLWHWVQKKLTEFFFKREDPVSNANIFTNKKQNNEKWKLWKYCLYLKCS